MNDFPETRPVRIGAVPGFLQRRKDQVLARSEWEEVKERMRSIINESRAQGNFRPYSPGHFAARIKPYCGNGNARQRLSRLYKLEGDCREAAHTGFGYSKCFEVELRKAKKPVQQMLI